MPKQDKAPQNGPEQGTTDISTHTGTTVPNTHKGEQIMPNPVTLGQEVLNVVNQNKYGIVRQEQLYGVYPHSSRSVLDWVAKSSNEPFEDFRLVRAMLADLPALSSEVRFDENDYSRTIHAAGPEMFWDLTFDPESDEKSPKLLDAKYVRNSSGSIDSGFSAPIVTQKVKKGVLSVTVSIRATSGGTRYPAGIGAASGDLTETTEIVRTARKAAEKAALANKRAIRQNERVIGNWTTWTTPVSLVHIRPDHVLPARIVLEKEDFKMLVAIAATRVFGSNKPGKSAKSVSRAGLAAQGMPITDMLVQEVTNAAICHLARWARNGLKGKMATKYQEIPDNADKSRYLISCAARDALRTITKRTTTTVAKQTGAFEASLAKAATADETVSLRKSVKLDTTDGKGIWVKENYKLTIAELQDKAVRGHQTRSDYLMAPKTDTWSILVMALKEDGTPRYPYMLTLLLNDFSVDKVAQIMHNSTSGASWAKAKKAIKKEYQNLSGISGATTEIAPEAEIVPDVEESAEIANMS